MKKPQILRKKLTSCKTMDMIASMLSFVAFIFAILLCYSHRKTIYASLIASDEIP